MPELIAAIAIIDKFITLGKELAKIPAMVLPQYQSAAADLYGICQRILKANENLTRWLHRFRYFDFGSPSPRSEFLVVINDYNTMKNGPEFQQLKFSCNDIANLYYREISSKIGSWFSGRHKREEAEGIFNSLADTDQDMVAFIYDKVLGKLEHFITSLEQEVDSGNLDEAERQRLEFKSETKEIVQQIEKFSDDLSELVISFANIAKIPITLGT